MSPKSANNKKVVADLSDRLGQAANVTTPNPFEVLHHDEDMAMEGSEQGVRTLQTKN